MSSRQDDAHKGGSITDMATSGTSIPNDAGIQRELPSKPNPHQLAESQDPLTTGSELAGAVDNPTDIPRRAKDAAPTGEVLTGTGHQMPSTAETKNLHMGVNDPLSKGHARYDKHTRQNESDLQRYAGEGAGTDVAPGEEGADEETLKQKREFAA